MSVTLVGLASLASLGWAKTTESIATGDTNDQRAERQTETDAPVDTKPVLQASLKQPAKRLTDNGRRTVPENTVSLSHVDDSAESKRSIAASGHAVRFERPAEATYVEAIQFFGGRYGTRTPPKDDFHVYLLNEQFQVLADLKFPYALIPRSDMQWHTLRTPSIEVPQVFHVALAFNPHQTKGIFLGLDESVTATHSLTGLVGDEFSKWKDKSDWMVRVHLADKPTGEKGIQKLADWKPPQPPADPFVDSIEVRYDDGESAGKQSYGGAGPVLKISLDEAIPKGTDIKDIKLKGLRVYCSRYGSGFDPETTKVHIDIVDANAKPLWQHHAPYSLFGYKEKWVDILFDEPVAVAQWLSEDHTLTIGVDPESHQRKGIYFHYSKPAEGRPTPGGFVPGKRFFKADGRQWLIRAYLVSGS